MEEKRFSGGNCDIWVDKEAKTARKKFRNSSSPDKKERFLQEVEVAEVIKQKRIPGCIEILETHNSGTASDSYILMRLYEGNLHDLLPDTRGNVHRTLRLILPVIHALKTLSDMEPPIIHRDIKPDNILFSSRDEQWELHLADFGICYWKPGEERLTKAYIAMGARLFMAPEYEVGRVDHVDIQGDVFSLGKVIWYLINGKKDDYLPYNLWYVDHYDLRNRFPDEDMSFANAIIAPCLELDPEKRPNYETLIQSIENILEGAQENMVQDAKIIAGIYQKNSEIELSRKKNLNLVEVFDLQFEKALGIVEKLYPSLDLVARLRTKFENKQKLVLRSLVRDNTSHAMYSVTYDNTSFLVQYISSSPTEDAKIQTSYQTNGKRQSEAFVFRSATGVFECEYKGQRKPFSPDALVELLRDMLGDYLQV